MPINSMILSIWFRVEVPGKTGLPIINSPNMTPVLHISTALVYLVDPNSISGALYHLVATYSVSTGVVPSDSFMETNLARPKSANLAVHWEFNKILDGFISLWINLPVCIYLIALSIWYTIYFLWIYSNILALITACKSFIIYIKIFYSLHEIKYHI